MEHSKQAWQQRKEQIVELAGGLESQPVDIEYTDDENNTWKVVSSALKASWQDTVHPELIESYALLELSTDRIPQLSDVSAKLGQVSGFGYRSVGGIAPTEDFFGGLANKQFLSTQFIRSGETPFYTEEPDVVHEVIGHGTLLAHPDMAELHRLAGSAYSRVEKPDVKQHIADVWWFSGEYGVVRSDGAVKAIGAGVLSSVGELEQFQADATVLAVDPRAMARTPYRIDRFQKVLFAGESIAHMLDRVGGFFQAASDDMEL